MSSPPPGKRALLAEARQGDLGRAASGVRERQPERAVGRERGQRIRRVVPRADVERQLHPLAQHAHVEARLALPRLEAEQLDVPLFPVGDDLDVLVREEVEQPLAGRDADDAAARELGDDLGLRLGDPLDGAEEPRCAGPICVITAISGLAMRPARVPARAPACPSRRRRPRCRARCGSA